MNNQKFFQNILKEERTYIKRQLAKIKALNFDMNAAPCGFSLTDEQGDTFIISDDKFFNFLFNKEVLSSNDEYNHFVSKIGEDLEIQNELEEFYYTELFKERFRNNLAPGSYESLFELLDKPTQAPKQPTFYESMSAKTKAYLDQDTWQGMEDGSYDDPQCPSSEVY